MKERNKPRRDITMRKGVMNTSAGLWRLKMGRYDPFNPDQRIYDMACREKLTISDVNSKNRETTIGELDMKQLGFWADIKEDPKLLHINIPALIVQSTKLAKKETHPDDIEDMKEIFRLQGFKADDEL